MTTNTSLRDRYSSCCGKPFVEQNHWPRTCSSCRQLFWKNPIPVVLILQPVLSVHGRMGLLLIRRGIEPSIGKLALPGGFQEVEDWREAACRELREECEVVVDPDSFTPFVAFPFASSSHRLSMLFFAIAPPLLEERLPDFVPNDEVLERLVVFEPTPCCFDSHTQAVREFFRFSSLRST